MVEKSFTHQPQKATYNKSHFTKSEIEAEAARQGAIPPFTPEDLKNARRTLWSKEKIASRPVDMPPFNPSATEIANEAIRRGALIPLSGKVRYAARERLRAAWLKAHRPKGVPWFQVGNDDEANTDGSDALVPNQEPSDFPVTSVARTSGFPPSSISLFSPLLSSNILLQRSALLIPIRSFHRKGSY